MLPRRFQCQFQGQAFQPVPLNFRPQISDLITPVAFLLRP